MQKMSKYRQNKKKFRMQELNPESPEFQVCRLRGNTTVNAKKHVFSKKIFDGRKRNTILLIWKVIIYILK